MLWSSSCKQLECSITPTLSNRSFEPASERVLPSQALAYRPQNAQQLPVQWQQQTLGLQTRPGLGLSSLDSQHPSFPTGFLPNSSTSVTLKLCINAQRLRTSALHWAMPFRPPTSSRTQYRHGTTALVSQLVSAAPQPPSSVLRSSARPSTIHLRPAAGVP